MKQKVQSGTGGSNATQQLFLKKVSLPATQESSNRIKDKLATMLQQKKSAVTVMAEPNPKPKTHNKTLTSESLRTLTPARHFLYLKEV